MAIVFVSTPVSLTANTLAKSADVNVNFASVGANFTLAGTTLQRAFKVPLSENGTDWEITQLAAARANKALYFDASGNLTGSGVALSAFDWGGYQQTGLPTPVNASSPVTLAYLSNYSSSLAGLPPVAGQAGRLLTTDGTVASWTTNSSNLTVGTLTLSTSATTPALNVNIITFPNVASFYISDNIGNGNRGINFAGGNYLDYSSSTGNMDLVQGGLQTMRFVPISSPSKFIYIKQGNASNNVQIQPSSGDLEFPNGAICTGSGTAPIAGSIPFIKTWANAFQSVCTWVDGTRTTDNKQAEIVFVTGSLIFRWQNDAHNASTPFLTVGGGYAAGTTSIAFAGPITNTKTIGYTAEFDNGVSGAAKTIDLSVTQNQKVTLTANTTLTLASPPSVAHYNLKMVQDATGGRTVAYTGLSAGNCPGGVLPAISTVANGVTFLALYWDGSVLWCKGSLPMI